MINQAFQVDTSQEQQYQTYADLIVNYLVQIDVEYIFGVPGGGIEPLFNAIARHQRKPLEEILADSMSGSLMPIRRRRSANHLTPVVSRHEAGSAFMADGYARETGKIGVCCATTGPGATNLITGIAAAYADRIPMLVITPQTALPNFGKLGLQESSTDAIDIVGMFEHCTRYNSLVSHADQVEGKLYTALLHAFRRPRGPVHLSIPMDILDMEVRSQSKGYQVAHLFRQPKSMDEEAYHALVSELRQAKKPVMFLGGGCRRAMEAVMPFIEQLNIPFVTTPAGKHWVDAYHPLYRGVFGFAGHQSAEQTLMDEEVDLIVAAGTRFGELSTGGWSKNIMNSRLVHIAATADDFSHSPMARLHVLGNLRILFANLYKDFLIKDHNTERKLDRAELNCDGYIPPQLKVNDPEECSSDAIPLKPQRVMRELAQAFPDETRFVTDAGNAWAWVTHHFLRKSIGKHRVGFGFGAMAWGIGVAVGTALGCRGTPVVCITGDGSFLMSGQEITVAVAEKLPVIFVVLNDQALGMVKHGQRIGGAEEIGYELPPVDFAEMARSMGAAAFTIRRPQDFEALDIEMICASNGPTLLDIYIDPEEIPPIGSRVKVLNKNI